ATGVFSNLKISLNKIWEIKPTPNNGIIAFLTTRLLSFGFVIGLGFLLMITLVLNALVIGFMDQLAAMIPALGAVMLAVTSWVLTTLVTAIIFALLFRFLPDARARWRDIWAGAIFTALLFGLGRFLIGFYIGNSDFSSTYGAAGALITLLVWTYYNSQILFLGAEFTFTWAHWRGNPILPGDHAVKIRREIVEVSTSKKGDRLRKAVAGRNQE
ncbi:MAG: YihY/virulence factor BrkB family protein, partial [Bacteroidota bacterium]